MEKKGNGGDKAPRLVDLGVVERNAVILTLVLVLGSLLFRSLAVSLGVGLGGFLALLNYFWLKKFVQNLLMLSGGRVSKTVAALYVLKYLITGAVIFGAIKYRLVNVFGLLAGLLVVIISVTLEGLVTTAKRQGGS